MEQNSNAGAGYGGGYGQGKKPWGKWILIYLVIAAIVYGFIYYFAFSKGGGYANSPAETYTPSGGQNPPATAPATY